MRRRNIITGIFGSLTAQIALAQGPQVNAGTQIKGLPPVNPPTSGGDNWIASIPIGTPNGSLGTFTLVNTPKKITVFLNGVRQYQQSEVAAGMSYNISVTGNILIFLSPVPQIGDNIVVDSTL